MLSQKLVFSKSKNFTSSNWILMPPTIPINHYGDSRNQQNRTARPILLFHANVFGHKPALNTLIFSKQSEMIAILIVSLHWLKFSCFPLSCHFVIQHWLDFVFNFFNTSQTSLLYHLMLPFKLHPRPPPPPAWLYCWFFKIFLIESDRGVFQRCFCPKKSAQPTSWGTWGLNRGRRDTAG